jgi:hypothetical protein
MLVFNGLALHIYSSKLNYLHSAVTVMLCDVYLTSAYKIILFLFYICNASCYIAVFAASIYTDTG